MEQNTIDQGRTMSVIAYITLIGLLIAYIVNNDKNNEFVKFHIGQSLRVWVMGIALWFLAIFLVVFTGIGIFSYLGYVVWIFAILGIINAYNGKMDPLPIIGTIAT